MRDLIRKTANYIKRTPVWFLIPAVLVLAATAFAIAGYEPLEFVASDFSGNQALASDIKQIDAEEIERESASSVEPAPSSLSFPNALSDGKFVGYASCGIGNSDGWKPYYVQLSIEISDGKVVKLGNIAGTSTGNVGDTILSWDASENQSYLNKAVNGSAGVRSQIESSIASGSIMTCVDTVSGATYSSVSIFNAYADALSKAENNSGNSNSKTQQVNENNNDLKTKKLDYVDEEIEELADGTWVGYKACGVGNTDNWKPYYVKVEIEVENASVKSNLKISGTSKGENGSPDLDWDEAENLTYLNWAINGRTYKDKKFSGIKDQIIKAIKARELPSDIDCVSGATYSSDAILGAYYNALLKSSKAAGSTLEIDEEDANSTTKKEEEDTTTQDPINVEVPDISTDEELTLIDGVYEGYSFCRDEYSPSAYSPYYIFVEIEVEDGKIVRISNIYGDSEGKVDSRYIYDSHENASYLNKAIAGSGIFTKGVRAQIQEKLDSGNPVEGIDAVSGATWSSYSILDAYSNAVSAAIEYAQDNNLEPEQE